MKKTNTILFMFIFIVVSSCGGSTSSSTSQEQAKVKVQSGKQITIFYPDWVSATAITHLAKVALEDQGYKVKIVVESPESTYKSLAQGEADLLLECWLPYTSANYWNTYKDKLEKLGVGYGGGTTGIVVPSYVDEKSIEDLVAAKDKYDGMIFGIGNTSGIHGHTEKAIEAYELPFVQATTSDIVMTTSLENAIAQNKAIAVTGWKPHSMWNEFKVRYLEDPKQIFPLDKSYIIARKGFSEENPRLGKFFKKFFIADKQLYSLMNALENAEDDLIATRQWYKENKEYIDKMWE